MQKKADRRLDLESSMLAGGLSKSLCLKVGILALRHLGPKGSDIFGYAKSGRRGGDLETRSG